MASSAENALSGGISFSGISLAVTGPEGDAVPQQLAQVMTGMEDISQYCTITAMDYDQALAQLESGDVTAVLVLPEQFISGVMDGTNPDITLIVPKNRPLESLLTLWVGQSASDMLAAVQAGVYGVLDQYRENPVSDLSFQDVLVQINLRYINWTLSREDMFRVQLVSAARGMEIGKHYALSLLLFLTMAMSAFFMPAFKPQWLAVQRRFRAVGQGCGRGFGASLGAVFLIQWLLLTLALTAAGGVLWQMLSAAAFCGGFCAAFSAFCCLAADRTDSAGLLSFGVSLVLLGLSGGILPPVMMPSGLQSWIDWSPVTWMRTLAADPAGFFLEPAQPTALLAATVLLIALDALLYRGRARQEVRGA